MTMMSNELDYLPQESLLLVETDEDYDLFYKHFVDYQKEMMEVTKKTWDIPELSEIRKLDKKCPERAIYLYCDISGKTRKVIGFVEFQNDEEEGV